MIIQIYLFRLFEQNMGIKLDKSYDSKCGNFQEKFIKNIIVLFPCPGNFIYALFLFRNNYIYLTK